MKAVFNFIGTATKKTGNIMIKPVRAYFRLVAKNYEEFYGKGYYDGPFWM